MVVSSTPKCMVGTSMGYATANSIVPTNDQKPGRVVVTVSLSPALVFSARLLELTYFYRSALEPSLLLTSLFGQESSVIPVTSMR
jgi:hypothetical protein